MTNKRALELISEMIKHLPGEHDQASHAGSKGKVAVSSDGHAANAAKLPKRMREAYSKMEPGKWYTREDLGANEGTMHDLVRSRSTRLERRMVGEIGNKHFEYKLPGSPTKQPVSQSKEETYKLVDSAIYGKGTGYSTRRIPWEHAEHVHDYLTGEGWNRVDYGNVPDRRDYLKRRSGNYDRVIFSKDAKTGEGVLTRNVTYGGG